MDRVRTGVPGLDRLTGGFARGDCILVKGGPGTGKTGLALQWICRGAADFGEPGAIIVLEETPKRFYRRAQAFGWDLRKLEEQNKVRTIFTSAEAFSRDIHTGGLLTGMLAEIGCRRVAIDPITHYRLVHEDPRQLRQQLFATLNALRRLGQTSLLVAETGTMGSTDPAPEEYLADAVIALSQGPIEGRDFRRLEILKSGNVQSNPQSALFRVSSSGVDVIDASSPPSQGNPMRLNDLVTEFGCSPSTNTFFTLQLELDTRRVWVDLAFTTLIGTAVDSMVYLSSSCVGPSDLWETAMSTSFGQPLAVSASEKRLYVLEPFNRRRPFGFPSTQFHNLTGYDGAEILSVLGGSESEAGSFLSLREGATLVCDISDMCYHMGESRFRDLLPRLLDVLKSRRAFLTGVVDPRLMTPESLAWVRGMANGVVRMWENGGAQFIQTTKSPRLGTWEPRLLYFTPEPPFIELFD